MGLFHRLPVGRVGLYEGEQEEQHVAQNLRSAIQVLFPGYFSKN
jgi:hypothetical protein